MKLDTGLVTRNLKDVPAAAKAAEAAGFDAIWTARPAATPFCPPRWPRSIPRKSKSAPRSRSRFRAARWRLRKIAWDLAGLSEGRFILGLGTQVKGHIERRYSTKWDAPVPRLREYVQSLRAIFKCWARAARS